MKRRILLITLASTSILAVSLFVKIPIKVIYNPTESAPKGYYLIVNSTIQKGDYVLANIPMQARILAEKRQYLPKGVPILKPVMAGYGDHICIRNDRVFINGRALAMLFKKDSRGRKLLPWKGCRKLSDEFFLISTYTNRSYDSRYFGPVTREKVIGKAVPLWIYESN